MGVVHNQPRCRVGSNTNFSDSAFTSCGALKLVRSDDPVLIHAVDHDLADYQPESKTEVRGYHPEGIAAMLHVEMNSDCSGSNHQFRGFLSSDGRRSLSSPFIVASSMCAAPSR